jgi:nicotinate-nucleotide adenylyltransferase
MMRFNLPNSNAGLRVGLLGGSFDPAHEGHVRISLHALKRFGLDQVWWLVSPGNPTKSKGPTSLNRRIKYAKSLIQHPRIKVTDIESHLQTRFTCDALSELILLYPSTNFTWLMGADNLAQVHHWQDWKTIFEIMPVGVLARPGQGLAAQCSPAARRFAGSRIPNHAAQTLSNAFAPAWCFVNLPLCQSSSSDIRDRGEWR